MKRLDVLPETSRRFCVDKLAYLYSQTDCFNCLELSSVNVIICEKDGIACNPYTG